MLLAKNGRRNLSLGKLIEFILLFAISLTMLQPLISSLLKLPEPITSILKSTDKAAFFPLFLLSFLCVLINKKFYFNKGLLIVFFIITLLSAISSTLNSHSALSAVVQYLLTFQGVILMLLLSQVSLSKTFPDKLMKLLSLLAYIALLVGFIEFFYPENVQQFIHGENIKEMAVVRGDFRAIISIFSHPALFAWFMGFMFCLNLSKYLSLNDKRFLYLAGMFFLAVLFSLRRKSIFACILIVVISILISRKSNGFKVFYACLMLFFFAIFLGAFSEKLYFLYEQTMFRYFSDSGFYTPRNILMEKSILIANQNFPLGSGLGTFGSWMSVVNYSPLYQEYSLAGNYGMSKDFPVFLTDTYWPMIIAELGWLGFFFVFSFWIYLLIKILSKYKSSSRSFEFFTLFTFLAFFQLIIESLSAPTLSSSPQIFIIIIMVTVVFQSAVRKSED